MMFERKETSVTYSKRSTVEHIDGIRNHYCNNDENRKNSSFRDKYIIRSLTPFNEEKFSLLLLYISLSIVFCKILYGNREFFHYILAQARRLVHSSVGRDGDLYRTVESTFLSTWDLLVKSSWLIVPLLIGLAVTFCIWFIAFMRRSSPDLQASSGKKEQ